MNQFLNGILQPPKPVTCRLAQTPYLGAPPSPPAPSSCASWFRSQNSPRSLGALTLPSLGERTRVNPLYNNQKKTNPPFPPQRFALSAAIDTPSPGRLWLIIFFLLKRATTLRRPKLETLVSAQRPA